MVMDNLKLSGSSQFIKYLMFIFNLLFVISGIILISIGSAICMIYRDFDHFLDGQYFSVPNLLIATGSIIFIIAFFGCCGAVRENYCMLVTFTVLMVLVFILELSAGISGYVLRNSAMEVIEDKMTLTMDKYLPNDEYKVIWDAMQQRFKCCGTKNAEDWPKSLWAQSNHNETILNEKLLPVSCCLKKPGAVGRVDCTINTPHFSEGCLKFIADYIKDHAVQIGGAGLSIAFMQGLGIWFSVYLAKAIKRSYNNM